jgi:hybrid cluster-associated redox disulfide protein
MKITRKTDMNKLLMSKPELAGLLFQAGMGCAGCPMSMGETLEEGCKVHGMTDKEIDKLVEMMNKGEEKRKLEEKRKNEKYNNWTHY